MSDLLEEGIDILDVVLDYLPDGLDFLHIPLAVGQIYLCTLRGFLPEKI